MKKNNCYLFWKRLFDIAFSFVGILVCLIFLWWWVLIINSFSTHGHPIFAQLRLGKNKKPFTILKFRSLRITANPLLAPFDMAIGEQEKMETTFGSFLRKTSIDETPQLLNIFIGQMSLIGPRPCCVSGEDYLVKEREKYTPNAYDVRPGLTGYAQVKMNRSHDPIKKAYFDYYYVNNLSFKIDFKTFGFTIIRLFGLMRGK